MTSERISTARVRRIIEGRIAACGSAIERYVVSLDTATDADAQAHYRHMAATERCARSELQHVLTLINQAAARQSAPTPTAEGAAQ